MHPPAQYRTIYTIFYLVSSAVTTAGVLFAAAVVLIVSKVNKHYFAINYTFIHIIGSPQKQPAATKRGSRFQSMHV